MRRFLLKHVEVFIILFAVIAVSIFNTVPHTYLTGWDNLQTELNPALAIKRALFSGWQEYQSFGLVSGMAHSADLVRAVLMGVMSFVIPQWFMRYAFHFMMLCIGAIGALFLFRRLFGSNNRWQTLFGALFYAFNIGTIQIFFMPFEPFSAFFASLPWLILTFHRFIKTPIHDKSSLFRSLIVLSLVNFLATPSFYLQTIFVTYGMMCAGFLGGMLLEEKHKRAEILKKGIVAGVTILIINLFWILPQTYFLKTNGNVVKSAKMNQISTEDVVIQNKAKGTIDSFLKLEGFYYELNANNKTQLFAQWKKHFNHPSMAVIQISFIVLFFLGLLYRNKHHSGWMIMLGICAVLLLTNTPLFKQMNEILLSPSFLQQMFRSPFTKCIVAYALVYSYFVTAGLLYLKKKTHFPHEGIVAIFMMLFFLYALPILNGHFLSSTMRVAIPQEYHEVISYFQNMPDKNKRIALLPEYTFWGWYYNNWGYNGSGFLWYGIEQPIISRTFDVWNKKSESYFWEMKAAIEAEDIHDVERIIAKYDIDYILLDKSTLPVAGSYRALQFERLYNLLISSKTINVEQSWSDLVLFSIPATHTRFIYALSGPVTSIGPAVDITNDDYARYFFTNWTTDITDKTIPDLYFPFRDFFTQTRLPNKKWKIYETDNSFLITAPLPKNYVEYSLDPIDTMPYTGSFENVDGQQLLSVFSTLDIFKQNVVVDISKTIVQKIDTQKTNVVSCDNSGGIIKTTTSQKELTVTTEGDTSACFGYDLPTLNQQYGYLIKIKNKNISGRRLFFYILDKTKQQSYVEERFTSDEVYYVIPPRYQYGIGYTISFQNTSYKNIMSENTLSSIEVYLLPYQTIKSIKFTKNNTVLNQNIEKNEVPLVKKINYFTYTTKINKESNQTIVLSQSYDEGWSAYGVNNPSVFAYFFPQYFGEKISNHVLVNNWANAWLISQKPADQTLYEPSTNSSEKVNGKLRRGGTTIVIIFWPQYLQFAGFGIMILTFSGILILKKRTKLNHTPIVIQ